MSTTSSASRPKQRSAHRPARELEVLLTTTLPPPCKKAVDVTVIDVHEVSGVTDYFVIGTGESDMQVRAIAEAVREQVKEQTGERPWKREGTQHNQWVVLDYVNVVVHIFDRERRAYYDLERLWGDAPVEHVAADADAVKLLQPESRK